MKRWIAVSLALALFSGCSGMGGGSRLLPGLSGPSLLGSTNRISGGRHRVAVKVRMTIPKRHRGERAPIHPSTISSATQSVGIGVNGAAAHVFNATPSSPNCVAGPGGTVCTFQVGAPPGSDTFAVKTYSGINGGGTVLDYGTAVVGITAGQANSATINIGPVVSNTSDSGPGSLRNAVGSASNGDTIMFLGGAGTVVTLSSPITPNVSITIAGPGFTTSLHPHVNRRGVHSNTTYSGLTISGNNAQQIFIVNAGVSLTLAGLIVSEGKAAVAHHPGGAISNLGTLTLIGDAITDNTSVVTTIVRRGKQRVHPHSHHLPKHPIPARSLHPHVCTLTVSQYGGAIYNDGLLNMLSTTFDGNTVSSDFFGGCTAYGYGGAIYNDSYGTINSVNDTYANNGGYYGGAIYNAGYYGAQTFTNDTFSKNFGCTAVNGCPATGCSPSSTCSTYAEGYGGAIYDDSSPGVTIESSMFTNNSAGGNSPEAYGEGGALYLDTGNPSITNSTFTGNVAGGGSTNESYGYGGALVWYNSQVLTLNNDTFTNNVAGGDYEGYGGAIYYYYTMTGTNDTFSGNQAVGNGSLTETDGYGEGGAIYNDTSSGPLTLSNSTFTNNLAKGTYETYGGALYLDSYSILTNDTFTGNQALSLGGCSCYTYAYGGAIYSDDYTKISKSSFTSNAAIAKDFEGDEAYGGAIEAASTFNSTNNTYTSNMVSIPGAYASSYAYGGAIYADSTFSSSGDAFKSNVVSGGGSDTSLDVYGAFGGAMYTGSTSTIANDTFDSNSALAPNAQGGGLFANSTTYVNNSNFTNNIAGTGTQAGFGGAIFDDGGLTLTGGTLANNTATNAGGGFYAYTNDYIYNALITGNTVSGSTGYEGGGGVMNDGPLTITNSTISGNKDTVAGLQSGGGGIYNYDALVMTGSTVSGNSVLGSFSVSGGGGIYSDDGGTITNSTISGNSSSIDGGGVEQNSGTTLSLINDTIFQNTATGNGGSIFNGYALTLTNSIAAGGTAAAGADVYNGGGATLTSGDYNITQTAIVNSGGTIGGTTTHNQVADPKLLPLTSNGGPTFTNADQASSPGVGLIPFAATKCNGQSDTSIDQRSFARGSGGHCDVGAFELNGVPSAVRVRPPLAHGKKHHVKPVHHQHADTRVRVIDQH